MRESSLSTRSVAGRIAARRVALLLCQLLPAACLRLFACQALFVFALVAETDNQQDDQQPHLEQQGVQGADRVGLHHAAPDAQHRPHMADIRTAFRRAAQRSGPAD